MKNSVPDIITQDHIEALLTDLKNLCGQITAARSQIKPLEDNLNLAHEEFQATVGPLRRHASRLQAEIDSFHIRFESPAHEQENMQPDKETELLINDITPSEQNLEAVEKDKFLEHIFRVLDPMVDNNDAELFGKLQGMCNDKLTTLADVLEELPWGPAWTVQSLKEDLQTQHSRLNIWKQSLENQIKHLNQQEEFLYKDPRYGLWLQYQRGADIWREFLSQAAEQIQEHINELGAELEGLRKRWAQMTDTE
ncbi:MAG: hypothetical protein GY795_04035 [Desulfobacterales bacterium]|nr:hypothetical protein [Desulfobacterales bacterium]